MGLKILVEKLGITFVLFLERLPGNHKRTLSNPKMPWISPDPEEKPEEPKNKDKELEEWMKISRMLNYIKAMSLQAVGSLMPYTQPGAFPHHSNHTHSNYTHSNHAIPTAPHRTWLSHNGTTFSQPIFPGHHHQPHL